MPRRQPVPFVWIFDEDLSKSAQYLTNKLLENNIKHLISCLISARCYYVGIRTQAIFKHYFSKDNAEETIQKLFPKEDSTDIKSLHKFSFQNFSNRTSKWARKCREHYLFFQEYLRQCLIEEQFRFGKIRKSHRIGEILATSIDNFAEEKIPKANLSKIIYEWKSIPVKYRRKDILQGYRSLFLSKIENPFEEYAMSKRDIPDFVMEKFQLEN